MRILFNNIKNPFLRCKIACIFSYAFKDKTKELKLKKQKFEVGIRFVSREEIRELNNRFRKVDKETDVLSFPLMDFNQIERENLLGDIVICKEVAILQAKKYGHSVRREICFLALHGFLHLLGYDHIESEDEKIMTKKAEEILKKSRVRR